MTGSKSSNRTGNFLAEKKGNRLSSRGPSGGDSLETPWGWPTVKVGGSSSPARRRPQGYYWWEKLIQDRKPETGSLAGNGGATSLSSPVLLKRDESFFGF